MTDEQTEREQLLLKLMTDFRKQFPDATRATQLELFSRLNSLSTDDLKLLAKGASEGGENE